MKRIIQLCQQKANNSTNSSQTDILKLRLRGRGSGFKEGPEKKGKISSYLEILNSESFQKNPMNLCIYASVPR